MNERVRYSRHGEKRTPKNTLFTEKSEDGKTIYFGISRCNSKLDSFRRDIGTYVAGEREVKAYQDLNIDNNVSNYYYTGALTLHKSGLRGSVKREYVKDLLEYFKSIDERLLKQFNESSKNDL